jgi:sulfur carrier protein ThiS
MTVSIKLHASLRNYVQGHDNGSVQLDDAAGKNLKHVIEHMGIDMNEIGFATKNSDIVSKSDLLTKEIIILADDSIELFTAMKGG